MKIDYRNTIIVVLLIVLSFSLGFNISKPKKAIGMATNYDKNAAVATLKTLNTSIISKNPSALLDAELVKYSYELPDPIYTDLISEYRRNNDKNKRHYLETMLYTYIKKLGEDPNYKKTYKFKRITGEKLEKTASFILFHGIKKFTFKIKSTPSNTDKETRISIIQDMGGGALMVHFNHIINKTENGEKSYEVMLLNPINASIASPIQCFFQVSPQKGTESWQIEVTDQ